jgi:hypothetical protein
MVGVNADDYPLSRKRVPTGAFEARALMFVSEVETTSPKSLARTV